MGQMCATNPTSVFAERSPQLLLGVVEALGGSKRRPTSGQLTPNMSPRHRRILVVHVVEDVTPRILTYWVWNVGVEITTVGGGGVALLTGR